MSALHGARKQILVEAYSFTSEPIAVALIDAEKRGVDVEVILDKSQMKAKGSDADLIAQNGIPTYIDSAYRISRSCFNPTLPFYSIEPSPQHFLLPLVDAESLDVVHQKFRRYHL